MYVLTVGSVVQLTAPVMLVAAMTRPDRWTGAELVDAVPGGFVANVHEKMRTGAPAAPAVPPIHNEYPSMLMMKSVTPTVPTPIAVWGLAPEDVNAPADATA